MRIPHSIVAVLFCCAVSTADAQSFQLLGFLGPSPSEAHDVSADGSVVIGISRDPVYGGSYQAFRWTEASGMVGLNKRESTWGSQATISGDSSTIMLVPYIWQSSLVETATWNARNSSYDGSIIVGGRGTGFASQQLQATRWSPTTGFVDLGFLPSEDDPVFLATSEALDVSANGNVVAGYSKARDSAFPEAFRWTPQSGMMGLGFRGEYIYVSADGSTIVATSEDGEIVRWTEAGGTQSLGKSGTPYGISGDGSRIVGLISEPLGDGGGTISYPFIWEAAYGIRNLNQVLTNDFGLGAAMAGFGINEVYGISDDGRTLIGVAVSSGGSQYAQAFVATIPLSPVPEPSAAILAISCAFAICGGWRQKPTAR